MPWDPAQAWSSRGPVLPAWAGAAPVEVDAGGVHPLSEADASARLRQRAEAIDAAFGRIEPYLRDLARRQFDEGFCVSARSELRTLFGLDLDAAELEARWTAPLDLGRLHARVVLATFCALVEHGAGARPAADIDGEDASSVIRRFGFHAVDITPCADGRLAGLLDHVLRVPPAVVTHRRSHAGAMFGVEETLRHWEAVELRRWREGRPNAADEATRYLKIGVYHFSSIDPGHEGCAAHGSDDALAAGRLLERLGQFERAVEAAHCCGASVATLLVGVDTDTDALRVHVPDAAGRMDIARCVCALRLHEQTVALGRAAAKERIRDAVAACAGVAADDAATEGMRWLCGYLLKNNVAQVDAVRRWHGAGYADRGHTERLIVAGDGIDEVQLRNVAFQAQMNSVEEGAGDLDVGVKILSHLHAPRGLAVPVLVHADHDPSIPGALDRATERARRLAEAVRSRYAGRAEVVVQAVVRARGAARLQAVGAEGAATAQCRCAHSQSGQSESHA